MHLSAGVRAVDRRVTAGAPARALTHVSELKRGVVLLADEHATADTLCLRVAFQAQVCVALHQQLGVDRAVRRMTDGAALAQSFVLEHKRPRLLAMALSAILVQPRHRQSTARFHDVAAVRVVALHAIHPVFQDRMMLGKVEFRVHFKVALKTGRRVFAGIDDEFAAPAPDAHMFAPGPVARFAAGHRRPFQIVLVKAGVGARRKDARDIGVAIGADFVADKMRAFDPRRLDHAAIQRGTGTDEQGGRAGQRQCGCESIPGFHR